MIASILQKTHEPLATIRGDVPVGLANVIDCCLQKEPARRYANVAELARALAPFGPPRAEQSVERIEGVLGVRSISVQPPPLDTGTLVAPMTSATFSPTTSRTTSSGSRILVPVLLAFVLVAAVGGVLMVRGSRTPAIAPTAPSVSAAAAAQSASIAADPVPSASVAPPAASSVTLTALPPSDPVAPGKSRPPPATRPSASQPPPPATTPGAPPAPSCHVVSYFDADGNKHFKQECP